MTFAVVGGGPTGVEFAGALAELVHRVLPNDYPDLDLDGVEIVLIEGSPAPLPPFAPKLRRAAQRALERKHVRVISGAMASAIDEAGLHLHDGRVIPAATVVWAAGVRATSLADELGLEHGSHDRVKVSRTLQVPGRIPRFASTNLRRWFNARPNGRSTGRRVLLWPDTFTNYLHPHVGQAAVRVLEAAGFTVELPERPLCCGLTWISTGQLPIAKRVLARTVQALDAAARAGTPIVGLEPSCTAMFRHDLGQLFPGAPAAQRVAEATVTLAELLRDQACDWGPPALAQRAIVQAHCHHQAVLGFDADLRALVGAGVDAHRLDSGCCGLAGNFGFERGHHDVSIACAERVMAPAIRKADQSTLIVADGFSCRTQIEHTTGRRALHLAEVLDIALAARAAVSG